MEGGGAFHEHEKVGFKDIEYEEKGLHKGVVGVMYL